MDVKQIQELIRFVAKTGVSEVQIEQDDFKLIIRTQAAPGQASAPVIQATVAQPQAPAQAQQAIPVSVSSEAPASAGGAGAEKATDESRYITIKSPMIGTFYRRPSPDKDLFVNVGDTVSKGQVVCVIEAMKLFNEIESDVSGKIVKVLVDDSSPVEYDQPLFLVDPS